MKTAGRIAIVGAGFSGAALAIQLLRRGAAAVTLVERSGDFGPGLAYGTRCERHLLNVRSGWMSLIADDPDHFVRWLRSEGLGADPQGFALRSDYGRYIRASLEAEASPGRLTTIAGEVRELRFEAECVVLELTDGRQVGAEAAVLATGNPAPARLGLAGLDKLGGRCIADPWAAGALDAVGPDEDVFLVGTGLTAVDVLLGLESRGWRGRVAAVSRRGLLPRTHGPASTEREASVPDGRLSQRLAAVRRRAATRPWTEVMDELRPHGQALWLDASPTERRRFLRHLRPWWDVHRHRMAPEIGAAVDGWRDEERLAVAAGRLVSVHGDDGGLSVTWRPRGQEAAVETRAGRLINCTGPQGDLSRAGEPLLDELLGAGAARTDPLRLGLDVDAEGRLMTSDGRVQTRVYAMGPLLRGLLWESVAVPEIRVQADRLAERLSVGRPVHAPARARLTSHLDEVGETYLEHMAAAWAIGFRALGAGAACMVHGMAPFWFTKTGSRAIEALHRDITGRRAQPLSREADSGPDRREEPGPGG